MEQILKSLNTSPLYLLREWFYPKTTLKAYQAGDGYVVFADKILHEIGMPLKDCRTQPKVNKWGFPSVAVSYEYHVREYRMRELEKDYRFKVEMV